MFSNSSLDILPKAEMLILDGKNPKVIQVILRIILYIQLALFYFYSIQMKNTYTLDVLAKQYHPSLQCSKRFIHFPAKSSTSANNLYRV